MFLLAFATKLKGKKKKEQKKCGGRSILDICAELIKYV